jgi:hypothetical protein
LVLASPRRGQEAPIHRPDGGSQRRCSKQYYSTVRRNRRPRKRGCRWVARPGNGGSRSRIYFHLYAGFGSFGNG